MPVRIQSGTKIMPSIKEEADGPTVNGVSKAETSTEHKMVFINRQCDGYTLLIVRIGALYDMPKTRTQRR